MTFTIPTRADDEAAVTMIRLRCAGYDSRQIAAQMGVPSERVRTITTRVRKADEDAEGRDLSEFYWVAG